MQNKTTKQNQKKKVQSSAPIFKTSDPWAEHSEYFFLSLNILTAARKPQET